MRLWQALKTMFLAFWMPTAVLDPTLPSNLIYLARGEKLSCWDCIYDSEGDCTCAKGMDPGCRWKPRQEEEVSQ